MSIFFFSLSVKTIYGEKKCIDRWISTFFLTLDEMNGARVKWCIKKKPRQTERCFRTIKRFDDCVCVPFDGCFFHFFLFCLGLGLYLALILVFWLTNVISWNPTMSFFLSHLNHLRKKYTSVVSNERQKIGIHSHGLMGDLIEFNFMH